MNWFSALWLGCKSRVTIYRVVESFSSVPWRFNTRGSCFWLSTIVSSRPNTNSFCQKYGNRNCLIFDQRLHSSNYAGQIFGRLATREGGKAKFCTGGDHSEFTGCRITPPNDMHLGCSPHCGRVCNKPALNTAQQLIQKLQCCLCESSPAFCVEKDACA